MTEDRDLRMRAVLTEYKSIRDEILRGERTRLILLQVLLSMILALTAYALGSKFEGNEALIFLIVSLLPLVWGFVFCGTYRVHDLLCEYLAFHLERGKLPSIIDGEKVDGKKEGWVYWTMFATSKMKPQPILVTYVGFAFLASIAFMVVYFVYEGNSRLWKLLTSLGATSTLVRIPAIDLTLVNIVLFVALIGGYGLLYREVRQLVKKEEELKDLAEKNYELPELQHHKVPE